MAGTSGVREFNRARHSTRPSPRSASRNDPGTALTLADRERSIPLFVNGIIDVITMTYASEPRRDRRRRPVRLRAGTRQDGHGADGPILPPGDRRCRADQGRHRRLRRTRNTAAASRGERVSGASAELGRCDQRRRFVVGGHGAARRGGHRDRRDRRRAADLRVDRALRRQAPSARLGGGDEHRRRDAVRGAVRRDADRQIRDGGPQAHDRVRHHRRATGRGRGRGPRVGGHERQRIRARTA